MDDRAAAHGFRVLHACGAARLGELRSGQSSERVLPTPAVLCKTVRTGALPALPNLLFDKLPEPVAMHLLLGDLLDLPPLAEHGLTRGLHEFSQHDGFMLVGMRNPLFTAPPSSAGVAGVGVQTPVGRRGLAVGDVLRAQSNVLADASAVLADYAHADCGHNRLAKSWERSLALLSESRAAVAAAGDAVLSRTLWLGYAPGPRDAMRAESLAALVSAGEGFLAGAFVDEAAVAPALPAEWLRVCDRACTPLEIVDAVGQGVDVFVSSYAVLCTTLGQAVAMAFPAHGPRVLALRDPRLATDARPLFGGCDCFACARHTRGYIHHLIGVEEMLGDTLLALHNTTQLMRFMADVRASLARGSFAADRELFRAAYAQPDVVDAERQDVA